MKKGILGLVVLFTLSSLPAFSSTPPKVGATCPKKGATQNYQGIKFTCVKSGKKLVWMTREIALPKPIIVATPSNDNLKWSIQVLNYLNITLNPTQSFSFVYALNDGIWNQGINSNSKTEMLTIERQFSKIELKVLVKQGNAIIQESNIFTRSFLKPVGSNSSSTNTSPEFRLVRIDGWQYQKLDEVFDSGKSFASILIRWPKQRQSEYSGFVVFYRDQTMVSKPCDLTAGLCTGPTPLDTTVYKRILLDPESEFAILDNLSLSSTYKLSVFGISGATIDISSKISNMPQDPTNIVVTGSSSIPPAPGFGSSTSIPFPSAQKNVPNLTYSQSDSPRLITDPNLPTYRSEKCDDTFSSTSAFSCLSNKYSVQLYFSSSKNSERSIKCLNIYSATKMNRLDQKCVTNSKGQYSVEFSNVYPGQSYNLFAEWFYSDESTGPRTFFSVNGPKTGAPENENIGLKSTEITTSTKRAEMKILLGKNRRLGEAEVMCVDIGSPFRFFTSLSNPTRFELMNVVITCENLGNIDIGARGKKWDQNFMITISNLTLGSHTLNFRWKYTNDLFSPWTLTWTFGTGSFG